MYYDQLLNYDQFINLGNNIQKEEFINPLKIGKNATTVFKKTVPKVTNVVKKTAPKATKVVKKTAPKVAAGALTVAAGTYVAAYQGELGEDAKAIADNIEDKVGNAAKETANVVKKTANIAGGFVGDVLWSFVKEPLYIFLLVIAFLCFGYCIYYRLVTKKYDRDFWTYLTVGVVCGGVGGGGFVADYINKHKDS